MWFEDFAQKARDEASWWADRLEREGIDLLRDSYEAVGAQELRRFDAMNAAYVQQLLGAEPRRREQMLKAAPDQPTRHALLLAAAYQARWAVAWLESACARSLEPGPRVPSRSVCANAAAAARAFREKQVPMWPL